MKPIIEVKGLWKEYQRGAQKERYLSLRDQVFNVFKPTAKKDSFYALEDINFDVYPGDSLAIIGKNGAGKSTLLKILSKITPPTKGEIILRGRLASLLEVGTGFHAELTGRENIYLNGSILGLKRHEINAQFDEIVEFSGVEDFLDTPLKHYSSGMQLRLAFAVAAHLEPEILVIDEVLAVGDSAFQQKCINKMTEVSQSGRTIVFVSHNDQAIRNLCEKAILLRKGSIIKTGVTETVLTAYQNNKRSKVTSEIIYLESHERKSSKGDIIFDSIKSKQWQIAPGKEFRIEINLKVIVEKPFRDLLFGININDHTDSCLFHLSNVFLNKLVPEHTPGNAYIFTIPSVNLKSGTYRGRLFLRANEEIQDWIPDAFLLTVTEGNIYKFSNSNMIQGKLQPSYDFIF